MERTPALNEVLRTTAAALHGSARRLFMARTVQALGPGGQRRAERALGWNRATLRKGAHELHSGYTCADAYAARGRHPKVGPFARGGTNRVPPVGADHDFG